MRYVSFTLLFIYNLPSCAMRPKCYDVVTNIIRRSCLATSSSRAADAMLTNKERIVWSKSLYGLMNPDERLALQGAYQEGFDRLEYPRYEKTKRIIQDINPFIITSDAAGFKVELALSFADIYRQERTTFDAYVRCPYIRRFKEISSDERQKRIFGATVIAVRAFDATLLEVARRIDASDLSTWPK